MKLAGVILAAGQGTRMKSALSKVLHPLGGQPFITYALAAVEELLGPGTSPLLVVGHGQEAVRAALGDRALYVLQEPQLGTGHALLQAEPAVTAQAASAVLVTYGDMPLIEAATLRALVDTFTRTSAPLVMATTLVDDPRGFGRVLRDGNGRVQAIVEEAQATPELKRIRELNVGVYVFDAAWLWPHLRRLPLSPKGEYYLTDLVSLAAAEGTPIEAVAVDDPEQFIGINTRVHLAEAEAALRRRVNRRHMEAGVTLLDPAATYIEPGVAIGRDTVVLPGTILRGTTRIGARCVIGPHTLVQDTTIGDDCHITYSVLEHARVEDAVSIGPFGHLRSGAQLERGVHMGNFGEVKNSTLGPGAKMGHFSYLGDASVGAGANIGAGTITCNFDGVHKNKTVIGENAFVGSDTMLVAPVTVGAGARTGAGSVVTHDVPDGATAYGVPARVQTGQVPGAETQASGVAGQESQAPGAPDTGPETPAKS